MARERSFLGVEGLGLIVGIILLPIGAAASVGLMRSDTTPTASTVANTEAEASTTTSPPSTDVVVETVVPGTNSADLAAACGEDGLELVRHESDDTITELQQAALDALRQVCAEAELPLPGPPAPPPVIRTVTLAASDSPTTTIDGDRHEDGDHDDDDHDDDDHDDDHDDDEDDDHDEDEDHEDEDHEGEKDH